MMNRKLHRSIRKGLAICLSLAINLLPLQGLIPAAQAAGGLNIPSSEQPQVLIILDNSQGMAGVLQATQGYASSKGGTPVWSTNLSGAIMTGSGTVSENANSSSPPYYYTANFTPPALGTTNGFNLFTVPCSTTSGLTAAAKSACASIGNQGYVDNSPSMLNAVEGSLANVLSTPLYQNNIQFGLETFKTSSPSLFNTWVYYMSPNSGFQFSQNASNTLLPVNNPCYNNNSNSCNSIYNYFYKSNNLGSNQLFNSPTLYIQDTSDNPIINDVLYANSAGSGSGQANAVGYLPTATAANFTLQQYENQQIYINFRYYTNKLASGYSPTSAGYISSSPYVWYAQRGYGYNANVSKNSGGNILVKITANNNANVNSILQYIGPETFPAGNTITASAGYSPVAGAFSTALSYLTSTSSSNAPPQTCGKKYVIFITDGQPTMASNGAVFPPLGSAGASQFGVTSITASTWSSTNDQAVVEAIQAIQKLAQSNIQTYVLGVGSAVNPNVAGTNAQQQAEALQGQAVLTAMAQAGGTGSYYSALTQADVQSALNSIVANILGKSVVSSYAAPPTVSVGTLEFLLKNVNPVTGQGDLYAYPVTSTGAASSTASWDANGIMTAATRSNALFTTPVNTGAANNAGTPSLLTAVASTNSAAFAINNTTLTASTIAQYTINPSYGNGQYLGGRQPGWLLGLPSSAPALVLTPPNSANLISAGGSYLNFAASHANRQNAVIFSDNDGFLYAIGYNNTGTPTLLWGWMPGALLPSLQNYNTFWQGNNMGNFASIDALSNNGKWYTYVVGTASNGGIIYDLQLTGTTAPTLQSTVAQYTLSGYAQPQPSAPVFYQVQNSSAKNYGATWALFALNNSSGSYLGILNVATGAWLLDALPFTNTATPYIDASGNLYLGDSSGNVYVMSNSTLTGLLTANQSSTIVSSQFTNIGNYAPWASSSLSANVQFIGGTFYQGANYLRVQGPNGITLFKQFNGSWSPVWTSYSGGAGTWTGNTFTPQGGSTANNSVSAIPAGAKITDQAIFNNGNVIVPITVPPASTQTCGKNLAEYYIFGLSNGVFPSGAYYSAGMAITTQGFVIGQGTAYTPSVSVFNGRSLLQGAASQNSTGGTSGFSAAVGGGNVIGGPVAWRLVLTQ